MTSEKTGPGEVSVVVLGEWRAIRTWAIRTLLPSVVSPKQLYRCSVILRSAATEDLRLPLARPAFSIGQEKDNRRSIATLRMTAWLECVQKAAHLLYRQFRDTTLVESAFNPA